MTEGALAYTLLSTPEERLAEASPSAAAAQPEVKTPQQQRKEDLAFYKQFQNAQPGQTIYFEKDGQKFQASQYGILLKIQRLKKEVEIDELVGRLPCLYCPKLDFV